MRASHQGRVELPKADLPVQKSQHPEPRIRHPAADLAAKHFQYQMPPICFEQPLLPLPQKTFLTKLISYSLMLTRSTQMRKKEEFCQSIEISKWSTSSFVPN